MEERQNPYHLPRDVEPLDYDIELTPDLAKFTFSGSETVLVEIRQPVSSVTLHALDLKIRKAHIHPLGNGGDPIPATGKRRNRKMESVTLEFGQTLPPGRAELCLEFTGELNDKMHGFYRTSYEANGVKQWGAATQFEATDARRAFPCWDEPDRKATFSAALTVPEGLTALSNMPVREESRKGGRKKVVFEKSPRMSTYLLAFVVAELDFLEATDRCGIPIRVYTRPGKKEQGRFALAAACHTLPYFADWFGIPYAFPKLDMVALPDFAAGAMENWGLVTYRDTALLVDPQSSSAAARQRVAEVVDHELAHQWFGNYTTMKWWTDLWLNEGFASYMGPKAVDQQFPEWDTWTQYVSHEYLDALHEDSLKNTHPVEVPVENPYEIREVFDAISYNKGSVINRMLEHYLGEEDFRKGLHHYLSRHAFGNATTDDLWQAIEEVSGKPVRAIMASYTRQPGYPVLKVRNKKANGSLVLELEQKRFLMTGARDSKKPLWHIPVGVLMSGGGQPVFEYMDGPQKTISLEASGRGWIKINPGQSGFYRVAYPKALWKRLAKAVEKGALSTVDRLGLLDDAFALARAGHLRTSTALAVLGAYRKETDYSVWIAVASVFASLRNLLSQEACKDPFLTAAADFFRPIAAQKGWERTPTDGHLDVLLRSLALRSLGGYGDAATVQEARRRFDAFRHGGELDPDLRQVVYSLVTESGGEGELEELIQIYREADLQEEKVRVLRAAGSLRQAGPLQKLLEFSLSDDVRPQDTPIILVTTATHPMGRELAWEFLKENWKVFMDRYHGSGIALLSRIINIASGFTTAERMEDVNGFFKAHRVPGAERSMKKALEVVRSNVAWLERDREDIGDALAGNVLQKA